MRGPGRTLDLENMRFSGPERTGTVATRGFVDFRKARRRAPAQARGYYKALRRTFDFYRELHSTETYCRVRVLRNMNTSEWNPGTVLYYDVYQRRDFLVLSY